jgi:hypothetical protein
VSDDGGLSEARAHLAGKAAAAREAQHRAQNAVDHALLEASRRVEDAIRAFLRAGEEMHIAPELFEVGRRQVGRRPLPRFGYQNLYWGFHRGPAPSEPIYEPGYTLHKWERFGDDLHDRQQVVMWQTGKVELRDFRRNKHGRHDPRFEGALPFHLALGINEELYDGSVPENPRDSKRQIDAIRDTADWFVGKLAAYLAVHGT